MDNASEYYGGAGHYDRETVRFFDVAHEGAQLRAVGGAAPQLKRLRGMQPRSLVVVGTDQIARAAARACVALQGPLDLPVVVADSLPAYVGPLDVVLFTGDAGSREADLRGLLSAAGRGSETVLAGPARGLLLDDAPAATTVIPALPTSAGPSPARTLAAVGAVLASLTHDAAVIAEQCDLLADAVDEELASLSPERDAAVNPARQLREFAEGARVLHSGAGPTGAAVAELAAHLWSARGIPSGYVHPEELALALEDAGGTAAASRDLFHDPFLDGPRELVPLKTVLWAQRDTAAPNTRAETADAVGAVGAASAASSGETVQAMRLVTRAFAATALDGRLDGGRNGTAE